MRIKQFFIFIFIFHMITVSWIPFFVFKQMQFKIRKEIKNQIKNGVPEEDRLIFYDDELNADAINLTWIHDREFRYHGEMYDILEKKIIKGRLVYFCIHDVKESGLFSKLQEMVNKEMSHNIPVKKQREMLMIYYLSFFMSNSNYNNFMGIKNVDFWIHVFINITQCFIKPLTPPPNCSIFFSFSG